MCKGTTDEPDTPDCPEPFKSEFADNFEVGLKGRFLENTLVCNIAAFYQTYDDYQVDVQDEEGIGNSVLNAASVEITGFETDFQWLTAEHLLIDGNLAYIDANWDEFKDADCLRPQYQAITDSASNTIADIRKIAQYGDELVAFSKDKLWSYASGDGLWTQRAEHLAVKLEEHSRFVTTGEQFDYDRAQLGGITMYCWTETTPSATTSYVAAIDQGTTRSRCALIDHHGAIVAMAQREHRQIYPKPGWVEHDPA